MQVTVVVGVLALLGCNSPGPSSPPLDSATDDAMDGSPLDSAPAVTGELRVRVVMRISPSTESLPIAGESIVFTDLVQTQVVQTDANGEALATVTGPTTVTQVHHYATTVTELTSVFGAMPGEVIALHRRDGGSDTDLPPVVATFPAFAGATSYQACTKCSCASATTSPISVEMKAYCTADPVTVSVVALYADEPLGSITATVPYSQTAGAAVTFAAPYLPPRTFVGSFANVPARTDRLAYDFRAGPASSRRFLGAPATNGGTVTLKGWDGLPATITATLLDDRDDSRSLAQYFVEPVTSTTNGRAFDLSAELLPWLEQPTFDPSTRTLHAPATAGVTADLFWGEVTYFHPTDGKALIWRLFAPSAGDLVLPAIPVTLADTTASAAVERFGQLFEITSVNGFAEARLDPFGLDTYGNTGASRLSLSPGR